jgi:hypothetical protein
MDVTGVAWRTSSYSGSNGGACVEVGTFGPSVAVRDSNHPDGPQLAFPASTWQAFTDQVKSGQLTDRIQSQALRKALSVGQL